MKKSFTLIEMLISITLFSVILIFLYQVLETTKFHNQKFDSQVEKRLSQFDIESVFFLDFLNKYSKSVKITEDKNNNSILQIKTKNTYHNPFYINITYFLSNENELMRIESKSSLKVSNISNVLDEGFIDFVDKPIIKFKIIESIDKNTYMIYVEYKNNKKVYFPIKNNL